ncbi:MAG: DMT family transporter [Pseudomonadota bacterium]|uniref:DMT family transporter n=1 Tax=Sphingomonas sp. ERG5 TaxID=1381597 RepID=UPI00054B3EDD|nr:DMT family transporter [Sphingomonas sp. ERG5]
MTRPAPNVTRAYLMLAIVMLFWAGNSIVARAVKDDIPPFTLAFVRWTGALIILLPLAWTSLRRDRAALLAGWRPVLLLGLVGVAGFNGFLYWGLHHTTATNGLLLQAAIPALVLMCNAIFFRERAGGWQIGGVILSTLGVAVVVVRADLQVLMGLQLGFGDLLILCGVLGWAIYTSLLRIRPALHQLSFLFVTFTIAALTMLPLALSEWHTITGIVWRPAVIGAFAYVAILPSVVAYFLFNSAVDAIGAARAGQTISLMPLFGAGLAAAVLGEALHPYHLVGMALILSGIAMAALLHRETAKA